MRSFTLVDIDRRREGMDKGRERDNGHRKRISPI